MDCWIKLFVFLILVSRRPWQHQLCSMGHTALIKLFHRPHLFLIFLVILLIIFLVIFFIPFLIFSAAASMKHNSPHPALIILCQRPHLFLIFLTIFINIFIVTSPFCYTHFSLAVTTHPTRPLSYFFFILIYFWFSWLFF